MRKSFIALGLASSMLLSNTAFANTLVHDLDNTNIINETYDSASGNTTDTVLDDILSSYHLQMNNINSNESFAKSRAAESTRRQIQEETVNALTDAGYEAYDVNPDTFTDIETALSTDLTALGLDSNSSYIIVLEGDTTEENSGKSNRASIGSSFSHTYNGTTYTMRYMTVTAADDSAYGSASSSDLLKSSSKTAITNCLNTALSAYISAVSTPLGTVASLCGLNVSNFSTAQTSTLTLNAATNWTRVYTQVWSSYDKLWLSGSAVEYVKGTAYLSGHYYSSSKNAYVKVPEKETSVTKYSTNYNNTTWRKNQAAIGYNASVTKYDSISSVSYKYGSTTKITHRSKI